MWFSNKRVILASQSPRRAQLLTEMGIPFIIKTNPVDESIPPQIPIDKAAAYLAKKKAMAAKQFLETEGDVLLTADSIVILDNTIYGKPVDRADAISILQKLSGRTHRVITGVCLLSHGKERLFSGISDVTFAPLSIQEIEYYIDHFKPFDKAGAYAIQEWIGLCKVSRIEGTFSNIMGLPLSLVYEELSHFW